MSDMGLLMLVRHGQASWGADDYDVLSVHGHEQAAVTGRHLATGPAPDVVVHGSMRRQRETARALVEAAGWDVPVREDPRWDEMDHEALLAAQPWEGDPRSDRAEFQAWFEAATDRWIAGSDDGDYAEPWAAFDARVRGALDDVAGSGSAAVVTSGGPIAAVTAALLGGGRTAYARVAPVVVNASVTRVIAGRRGLSLLSLNEHDHLRGELRTYR
jgi:broad specificity phosphatase PhoE